MSFRCNPTRSFVPSGRFVLPETFAFPSTNSVTTTSFNGVAPEQLAATIKIRTAARNVFMWAPGKMLHSEYNPKRTDIEISRRGYPRRSRQRDARQQLRDGAPHCSGRGEP